MRFELTRVKNCNSQQKGRNYGEIRKNQIQNSCEERYCSTSRRAGRVLAAPKDELSKVRLEKVGDTVVATVETPQKC